MEAAHTRTELDDFLLTLLRAGTAISTLAGEMIEAMGADGYSEDERGDLAVAITLDAMRAGLEGTDLQLLRDATTLIDSAESSAKDRVALTAGLAEALRGGSGEPPRQGLG